MAEIGRAALFGKLNPIGYRAIEAATVFCKMRGNPYVELVHWVHQILQLQDSDLHRIIRQFNLNPSNVARDLTEALDRLPRGASTISDLGSSVEESIERGWVYGTLMFGESQVRTGHLSWWASSRPAACAACCTGSPRSSRRSRWTRSPSAGRSSSEARPRRTCGPATASRPAPRPAGPAASRRRPRWASRRRSRSSPSTSPSARARARSTRSSAATRRSARSSTS